MQALKWLGILLGLVVVVIVAAVIIIPMVVNPNDFKDEIAEAVHESTGRELTLKGDIELSVWPSLSLDLGEVTLSNAEGFGDQPFAHINVASVSVALMPLLDKQVEADKIVLKGVALNLQVMEDGRNNWDDLAGAKDDDQDPKDQNKSQDGAGLAALAIGGIEISDTRLSWDDRQNNQKLELSDLDLITGAIELREPIDIEMSFKLVGEQPQIEADVALASTVEMDLLRKTYRAKGTKLSIKMKSSTFGVNSAELNLAVDVLADLTQKVVSLGEVKLDVSSDLAEPALVSSLSFNGGAMYRMENQTLRMEGTVIEFDAKGDAVRGQVSGTINTDIAVDMFSSRYDLTNFDLNAKAEGKDIPGGKADIKFKSNIAVDLTQDNAALKELVLDAFGIYLTGDIDVANLQKTAQASGKLNLAEMNPKQLMEKLGLDVPVTSDASVMQKLALNTAFTASENGLALSGMSLKLDDTNIKGNLGVKNFTKPAINFKLNVDNIDVDRYLPPASASSAGADSAPAAAPESHSADQAAAQTAAAPAQAAAPVGIPLDAIRDLNLNGVLDIGHLKVNKLNTDKVHLNIKAKGGVLDVNPFRAQLYQGSAVLKVHVDASKKVATYRINNNVSKVQIGPLLKDLNGDDKLQGTANINAAITTRGNDVDAIKTGLNGTLKLDVTDGALKGVNIRKMIKDAKAALKGGAKSTASAEDKTAFSSMHISGKFKNGVFSSNDLDVRSPLMRIGGDGQVNLPANSINYLVKAKIVGTSKGQGGDDLDKLKGLTIPVRVKGSLDDPGFKVDLGKVLEGEAKRKLKEKAKKKLQDKLGGKLGGLLGGAVAPKDSGSSEAKPAEAPKEDLKEQLKKKLFKSFF